MMAATPQTTITAFLGWPPWTRETQVENGSTPSRATAKTNRDAATIAIAVFYWRQLTSNIPWIMGHTSHKATIQMMFMNI